MTHQTITKADLVKGLAQLGLPPGSQLLMHSSLSSFGQVEGGALTIIKGVLAALGPAGTLLVPTLTGSEALSVTNPPTFDPDLTPCWTGKIPQTLMQQPQARRSLHPTHSVAGIGRDVDALIHDHIDSITPCDECSPYYKLAMSDQGYILLAGVDHESNTTFHCVEEVVGVDYHLQAGLAACTLVIQGQASIRHFMLHRYGPERHFGVMEPVFIERGLQREVVVGRSTLKLIRAAPMFRLIVQALRADRGILLR